MQKLHAVLTVALLRSSCTGEFSYDSRRDLCASSYHDHGDVLANEATLQPWHSEIVERQRACHLLAGPKKLNEFTDYFGVRFNVLKYANRILPLLGASDLDTKKTILQFFSDKAAHQFQPSDGSWGTGLWELSLCALAICSMESVATWILPRTLERYCFQLPVGSLPPPLLDDEVVVYLHRDTRPLYYGPTRAGGPSVREKFVSRLPQEAFIVEVGVFKGELAELMLSLIRPRGLILIDMWEGIFAEYGYPANQSRNLRRIQQRFHGPIRRGQVRIVQGQSTVMASNLPDGFFDVVYIDADHSYETVQADLRVYAPKLHAGGLLCGHDYNTGYPGVSRAVNEWMHGDLQAYFYHTDMEGNFCLKRTSGAWRALAI